MPVSTKFNEAAKKDFTRLTLAIFFVLVLTLFCQSVQYPLIIPLFLLFLGTHLYFLRKTDIKRFFKLGLLLALLSFTVHLSREYGIFSPLYIPTAAVAMLTMLLFNDLEMAFLMALTSSLLVTLMTGANVGLFLTVFLGSLIGVYSVREARTRGQIIGAGLFVSLIQVICFTLSNFDLPGIFTAEFGSQFLYPLCANGFIAAFVVIAALKIFEYLFGVLTNFSLLELSDFNHPLLKRMILEAPGTYHHSLVVSNLAEAAADAIGANALLTRVGAYYHDIGKLVKPEYFTENQMGMSNKHDNIEPSVSRLVILNHVKEGMDLARKYKLSQTIIDFIPQHHGTSLMHYFYQRALEEAEDPAAVKEEDFRYPGPKPQTKEAAIIMLADSSEGATRSLDEATPANIEETVKKIINNKFIDGQLDECLLTLAEINKISLTFSRVLSAMYHSRVKYPEKKNGSKNGNSSRKLTEKNIPPAAADQKNRQSNP